MNGFRFFGGVPRAVVCDQLKSGVTLPCRYEPGLQRTYADFAQHYGPTVLPTRPAKPRDKAKIEVGVQVTDRWILARLRHEMCHSLAAMNARIGELLGDLNTRRMRRYQASRTELFERLDRPMLRPVPTTAFASGEWKLARVNLDYHIELDAHYYSVPCARVDVRRTAMTVEIFHRGQRVATHLRSQTRGQHTTVPAHMPKAHQAHREWRPSRLLAWAATIGPQTMALVDAILSSRSHPEQGDSVVSGTPAPCPAGWRAPARSGLCAGAAPGGARLSPCRGDAQTRTRSGIAAGNRSPCPPRGP